MGMAPRHIPGLTHPVLPSHLQPMVGPCLSSGRSSPRASIQARCCFNRRLCHGLGGHVHTGTQPRGSGQGPSCSGISIASSCWQYSLLLRRFRMLLHEKHILVRSDNTATVCVHQPPGRSTLPSHVATRRHLLLWSQKHLRSLRAVHVPGELNRAADELSRQHALPGEWRLHPEVPQLSWRRFGDAQVDLLPSPDTSHCQLFFSLSEGTLGTDALACSWPRAYANMRFPSEPSRTDPVQGQGGRGASPLGDALLAQSDLVPRTNAPRDSPSLANSSEEGSTFSERGHPLAPAPRLVEPPRMVLGRDAEVLSGLPPAVVNTITSARALSTRQAYRLEVEPVRQLVFSPAGRTPVDARSQSCFLSCRMGGSEGCLPPPSKCMSPLLPHITMQ